MLTRLLLNTFVRNVVILAVVIVAILFALHATSGDGAQSFDYAGF
ncbi:MAG: hypothetical protein AAFZ65_19860 [Planctomycetota bacterium]